MKITDLTKLFQRKKSRNEGKWAALPNVRCKIGDGCMEESGLMAIFQHSHFLHCFIKKPLLRYFLAL